MTTNISNSDDLIDVRDVIARVELLREERDTSAFAAEVWAEEEYPELSEELDTLENLLSDLAGKGGDEQWEGIWYPVTLIRETYFVEAMQELVQDIGDLPQGIPSYLVIDWEATAENLRADYSSVEYDGVDYWYR